MKTETDNTSLLEKARLVRLLRRAALAHIQRDYEKTGQVLREAAASARRSGQKSWKPAEPFLLSWALSVENEQAGRSLRAAPAAWIHLGQEIATELESGGDWIAYLRARWGVEKNPRFQWQRPLQAVAGGLVFLLGLIVLGWMAAHLFRGTAMVLFDPPFASAGEAVRAGMRLVAWIISIALWTMIGWDWLRPSFGHRPTARVAFLRSQAGLMLVNKAD